MALYQDQFAEIHDFPPYDQTPKFFIIASTPRSGSHMLGHLLHQTGSFGFPLEYFNSKNLAEWQRRLSTRTIDDTLAALIRRRTSPNGVFGLKLHFSHLDSIGGARNISVHFPNAKYVLISRQNVLDQAISYEIASQTGVWISGQVGNGRTPTYNFESILLRLAMVLKDNTRWRHLFAVSNLPFIEVVYESLREDWKTYKGAILNFCKIDRDTAPDNELPRTKPQTSELNRIWKQRFFADYAVKQPQHGLATQLA